jgi:hypothetical protein
MKTTLAATLRKVLAVAAVSACIAGCGRPFNVKTAPGFIELEQQTEHGFLYRATTPEGIVVGVRVIEDEDRGDLSFWVRTVTLQLRDIKGYALTTTTDVKSHDGTPGKRLAFGHDEDHKPYAYDLLVFRTPGRVFMVEAGGKREDMERVRPSLEWMLANVEVRCNTMVSPVLASRTCNRW